MGKSMMLSKLSDKEKQELYQFLKNDYTIDYRETLLFPDDVKFGIEIEVTSPNFLEHLLSGVNWIENAMALGKNLNYENGDWKLTEEKSVAKGYELVSPILTDDKDTWVMIAKACEILRLAGAYVDDNCAAHVHVGAESTIKGQSTRVSNLFKVAAAYEDVLYKFGYGKSAYPRSSIMPYSLPFSETIRKIALGDEEEIDYKAALDRFFLGKHKFINIQNMRDAYLNGQSKNTVEFRNANGTLDATTWQNLINAFVKTVLYASGNDFDKEFIDYKLFSEEKPLFGNSYGYSEIYFGRALEFVDLIFDNLEDKFNFLSQYILKSMPEKNYHK